MDGAASRPLITPESLMAALPTFEGQIGTERTHDNGNLYQLANEAGLTNGFTEEEVEEREEDFYHALECLLEELEVWSFEVGYPWGLGGSEGYRLLQFASGELAMLHEMSDHPLYVPLLGPGLSGQDVLDCVFDHLIQHFDGQVCVFAGEFAILLEEGRSYPVGDRDFLIMLFGLDGVLGLTAGNKDILRGYED